MEPDPGERSIPPWEALFGASCSSLSCLDGSDMLSPGAISLPFQQQARASFKSNNQPCDHGFYCWGIKIWSGRCDVIYRAVLEKTSGIFDYSKVLVGVE
jgi:hypothetical protein